jgi:diadenosine tetraphosphatase ApaH/serine/threonine PP2A family protein phosphatase
MRWAILSDVHGNLPALEAVLSFLDGGKAVDGILFLGDAVGYGVHPNECMERLREVCDLWVAGNHDWAVAGKAALFEFNEIARVALEWTSQVIQPHHVSFLEDLPLVIEGEDYFCVHSTPQSPERWDYLMSWDDVEEAFRVARGRICFLGHSHIPLVICDGLTGVPHVIEEESFEIDSHKRYIINPGSVGQPRDGDPRAALGLWDTDRSTYSLQRVPYDVHKAAVGILEAGLPSYLAHRLYVGR